MEVMPGGTRFLGDQSGFRPTTVHVQSKNPAEWPGRGPETRSHSGRGARL